MPDHNAAPDGKHRQLVIDARGLACPLPVLKLRKALKGRPAGFEAALIATDRATLSDVPAYCREAGLEIKSCESDGRDIRFHIVVRG